MSGSAVMARLADLASGCGPFGALGPAGPVGLAPGQDWYALASRREAWRAALTALPDKSGTSAGDNAKRAALYFEDTFAFTAALLGAWAAGCTAVIAGDATEITTASLAGKVDVFLGDFPFRKAAWREPPAAAGSLAPHPGGIPLPALPVIIFTSGSTGLPLAVEKAWSDLQNEVETLESALGAGLSGARVLSTVSHQHIYGLLFRCLWPLAAGRPFSGRLIRFPEELDEARRDPGPALLVASPAFLRRLPEARLPGALVTEPSSAEGAGAPLAAVFSSGGPLPWACVPACAAVYGAIPTEIYGSSETGGIAWRLRTEEDPPWTLFPKVEIATGAGDLLWLTASPHVAALAAPRPAGAAPFAVADRAHLTERGFRLLGRGDSIVKLEEKRLSLTAMETWLATHPRVAEARLLVLGAEGGGVSGGERGREREILGAVLRLRESDRGEGDAEGIPTRGSEARRALLASLRGHLLRGFDPVLLPKRWRMVSALPVNAAGKTVLADLRALFEPQVGPVILCQRRLENGAAELELDVPAELEHFRGHFPRLALLPGVVQLDWAIREGARLFGPFGAFRGLQTIKFQRPIVPGMRVRLGLARLKEKPGIAFTYDSAQGRHASGQALFHS